ncbi:hypothetical protein GCM10010317_059700 [Streptomyces mirabilis]|uniref:DUF4231 domain-containing protein n=1 Tax=Streptomyces mirabilis TaxID=68239 RepID=UPI00167D3FAE|nr:DUF4231 domain-containing protein [Streptomyces mirabilis]GHD63346.1 hypothetical protein GCM10010317_059700 [Streptomyces mirabilis]
MSAPSSLGPVARLREHNERILKIRQYIREVSLRQRLMYGFGAGVVLSVLGVAVPTALTWQRFDMAPINTVLVVLAVVSAAGFIWSESRETIRRAGPRPGTFGDRLTREELELDLEIAIENRLIDATPLDIPIRNRQFAYSESIPEELDQLRKESHRYRRRHNFFQLLIIIGSIANAGAQSFSDTTQPLKSIIIGLTMLVAICAGITGYYKFRERSFNLQQTSDTIEEHANAFHLGLPPYDNTDPAANLALLTAKVETLRVEQRRREQQLDQPPETRDPSA